MSDWLWYLRMGYSSLGGGGIPNLRPLHDQMTDLKILSVFLLAFSKVCTFPGIPRGIKSLFQDP